MAITNLVLVVGAVKAAQYKDAQFDLHRVGIPTKVLRMTEGDWELDNIASAVLDAIDKADAYAPSDLYEDDDIEAQLYLADREDDEIAEPETPDDLHYDKDDEDTTDSDVIADTERDAYEADRVSPIESDPELDALRDESQAYRQVAASRFPRTGAEVPIAFGGSAFKVALEAVVDLQAKYNWPEKVAAAQLVIDRYLMSADTRVRAVVMSEPAYHSEWSDLAWFRLLPDDVLRYVVRPDGKVEVL